jgi:signal transduction histidine kinase
LIISLVETHKKRLKENKQRIKVVWEACLIINADKDLFVQMVHNLIWNFLKYAWKNTLLKINITRRYIDFYDNWVWVKSSEIPFLTEKFYQSKIEKTGDIDARWIWVWLSIVAKIINSHNWWYEIKSELWKWFSFKITI